MFRPFLTAAALVALSTPALADVMIKDAYARASGPSARAGAAFMEIHGGETGDRLIAARSEAAHRVEIHTHIIGDDGVARMREVKGGIPVPAGETVTLKRGGLHVMFMGLTRRLEQGDSFPLTLVFESGAEVVVEVKVDNQRRAGGHGMKMKHGHGHGMKHQ